MPLKHLSNFWRIFEMPLINCEVNLILTWSPTCIISSATGETKFKITKDKAKLLQQLKSGFKRTINWNKFESNIKAFTQNRYLNHLINPSFQEVNKILYYILKMKMIEHHTQLIIF